MGFTKKELIQFMDELVELAGEENKTKAIMVKEKFISDFEKSYGFEKEVETEVSYLPPHYVAAMPDSMQEKIKEKVIAALTELYAQMEQSGKTEIVKETAEAKEPEFKVKVTPFEREGSNVLGLARIYFENSFVVGNVSILQGKEKEFVAMPSYKAKQTGKDGKPQYQDVCFPITKEFREKLYDTIMNCYQQEKEKVMD